VLASALSAGVIDKFCLFFAPKLLGGDDGVPMFSGPSPSEMAGATELSDMTVSRVGEDILIEGYLKR
jgi:diaminohydroxyphosphoribosylaminopyrimidine deaminase/5-amino-6-(5-phosphoribosylamino)uracil reductase